MCPPQVSKRSACVPDVSPLADRDYSAAPEQVLGLERMVRDMARQLARGMGSFFKDCGCAKPTRCPHPYSIRFRDALGKQREESGYDTQDAEKKTTAPSVAAARRELGQLTVEEYAKQWRPRQRRMTDYSTGWHVGLSFALGRWVAPALPQAVLVLQYAAARGWKRLNIT